MSEQIHTQVHTAYPDPEHARPSEFTADRVARLVTELGVGWAKYGITIGRLALKQSARALETTSDLLGVVAQKMEKVAEPGPEDAKKTENAEKV